METVISPDGTPIAFARSGHGPPLVLVHGTTADHTRWPMVLPDLERRFTVLAMDRRGRGGSGDAATYSVEREFDDVATVVEAAGEGASLLGHSYGALCAMEAALRVGNLRRLVLYEPPASLDGTPILSPLVRERLAAIFAEGDRDKFLTVFLSQVAGYTEEQIAVLRADPSWQRGLALVHTVLRELNIAGYRFDPERFRRLSTPTLLLLGETSPAMFTAPTRALEAALPNCRVAVLEGQGHVAINTAPDLFLREVVAFLAD